MPRSGTGYRRVSLSEVAPTPGKPGTRREVSPALEIGDYNYNVADLPPETRLSRSGYHYHDRQREFYHVVAGRCRVEVDDGAFVMETDDACHFEAGVNHMLHNPYDDPCRLVAVGAPPDAHQPSHQVQSYEALVDERYGGEVPAGGDGSGAADGRGAEIETETETGGA